MLKKKTADETAILDLMSELEFNQLAKRILGDNTELKANNKSGQMSLFGQVEENEEELEEVAEFKTLNDLTTKYVLIEEFNDHQQFAKQLLKQKKVCFDTETSSLDTHSSIILGLAFSFKKGEGYYCSIPKDSHEANAILELYITRVNNNPHMRRDQRQTPRPSTTEKNNSQSFEYELFQFHK